MGEIAYTFWSFFIAALDGFATIALSAVEFIAHLFI